MIKASELRIGNWLFYKNDTYTDRRNKIHPNWFQVAYIGDTIGLDIGFEATQRFEKNPIFSRHIKELKPIPLTPEILEQCGFVHEVHFDESYYIRNGVWFCHTGDDWYLSSHTECKAFQNLHQLQNLYFGLSGEELTFHVKELRV